MRGFLFVLTVSVFVPFAILTAQQNPLQPGSRVRITAPDCGLNQQTGMLDPSLGDTLVLAYGASNARCLRSNVTRLEVSRGRRSKWVTGLGLGLLGGALVGAAVGPTLNHPEDGLTAADWAAVGVLLGAPTGMVLGTLIGASIKRDRWEEVPLDRLRVSFAPKRDGFAFGMSVAF